MQKPNVWKVYKLCNYVWTFPRLQTNRRVEKAGCCNKILSFVGYRHCNPRNDEAVKMSEDTNFYFNFPLHLQSVPIYSANVVKSCTKTCRIVFTSTLLYLIRSESSCDLGTYKLNLKNYICNYNNYILNLVGRSIGKFWLAKVQIECCKRFGPSAGLRETVTWAKTKKLVIICWMYLYRLQIIKGYYIKKKMAWSNRQLVQIMLQTHTHTHTHTNRQWFSTPEF
jgi:hypothetical protein